MRRTPLWIALAAATTGLLAAAAPGLAAGAPALAQIGDFSRPVHVASPPRDTRTAFVVERGGTVRLLVDGAVRARPFLDIRSLVETSDSRENERGLLSIAFAPDYALSGRFYVYYTSIAGGGDIQVDEFRRGADPEVADPATRRALLTVEHSAYGNHNGGQLAFGPDGALYAGTGDGGGAGDPLQTGQNIGSQLGKLLRLDPVGGGATSTWSLGLRNPFRFSFDRLTGDLAVGDVGQSEIEEIDFVPRASGWGRGANFGWSILEGSLRYGAGRPAQPGELPPGYVAPVIEHPHSAGWCSITGGFVVRDPAIPELYGRYVYGDYCKGELHAATLSPAGAAGVGPIGLRVSGLSSFGEDGCGRIYATSIDGPVYRLATTGACAGPAPLPFPAPGDAPATGPSGPDAKRPAVKLRVPTRQRVLRTGYLRMTVGCDELCRVAVTGRLLVPGKAARTTLRRARRTLAANARVALKVPIPLPARRLLRSRFTARPLALARVSVSATDATGNRRTVRTRVLIAR